MNIVSAMKSGLLRIDNGNRRWLYYHEFEEKWIVREHKSHARYNPIIISTASEEEAVKCLLEETPCWKKPHE